LLKENLRHFVPVADGIHRWFSQKHAMFSLVNLELLVYVFVDLLHLVPVLYDSMLDRVIQL
jgi:hypothetical protein